MEAKVKFFKELNPLNKCEELSKNYDISLILETISLSEYSPQVVQPVEELARLIFSPLHIEEDGSIKASAFHDVKDKGLSINRLNYIDAKTIHRRGNLMVINNERSPRTYVGYIKVVAQDIHKLEENNQRLFCVYDTATDEDNSHADICAILLESKNSNLGKKAANKQRRKRLQKLFSSLIS